MYETNVASCRIWDALGFKRIGRVKGCGNLRSYPDHLVDAIIYGRDLGQDEDFVSEERFDKIRYYLKHGKYPNGADRAEKSRLRSAATHYKLIPATGDSPEMLMLKGKEVIADPSRQYEIAKEIHARNHGGINKTTAAIAEKYHWVRIKETVSAAIRSCNQCNEVAKAAALRPEGSSRTANDSPSAQLIDAERGEAPSPGGSQASQTPVPENDAQSPQTAQADQLAAMLGYNYNLPVDPRLLEQMQAHGQLPHGIAPTAQMIPASQYPHQDSVMAGLQQDGEAQLASQLLAAAQSGTERHEQHQFGS